VRFVHRGSCFAIMFHLPRISLPLIFNLSTFFCPQSPRVLQLYTDLPLIPSWSTLSEK
jgi:hypothetical protein